MLEEAQKRIDQWLASSIDEETKDTIRQMLEKSPEKLEDAFSSSLSFGTGGMRGLMGVGSARLNRYTIQKATQGLADYLKQQFPNEEKSVFIGYDSRHNSREFALEAAKVLAGNDIIAYVTKELRPTPFVSYGCRSNQCKAAIMITASHNPPEYNGYKVYWEDGAQVISPHDKGIVKSVQAIQSFDQVKSVQSEDHPLIHFTDEHLDEQYIDRVLQELLEEELCAEKGEEISIVYTPLHGTGGTLIPKALNQAGFIHVEPVPYQSTPDGSFPTVQVPNPEDLAALSEGISLQLQSSADLLLATDPDADRTGVVVLRENEAFPLTGNQIACLMLWHIASSLKKQEKLPSNGAMVTTIVSTPLLEKIALSFEITPFKVLTGFKYIGEKIKQWEHGGYQFLFGAEESYGFLKGTYARDKDSTIACLLASEMALRLKNENSTLFQQLLNLYEEFGFHFESQHSIQFPPSSQAMQQMNEAINHFKNNLPQEIAGKSIVNFLDYSQGIGDLPPSNVLEFTLEDESTMIVRPSGTEPKIKIYGMLHKPFNGNYDEEKEECEKHLKGAYSVIETALKAKV